MTITPDFVWVGLGLVAPIDPAKVDRAALQAVRVRLHARALDLRLAGVRLTLTEALALNPETLAAFVAAGDQLRREQAILIAQAAQNPAAVAAAYDGGAAAVEAGLDAGLDRAEQVMRGRRG